MSALCQRRLFILNFEKWPLVVSGLHRFLATRFSQNSVRNFDLAQDTGETCVRATRRWWSVLTNLVGNGVATVIISSWEGEFDKAKLHEIMAHPMLDAMEAKPA